MDPGFEPGGRLAATISLPCSRYPDGPAWTAFVENLRQRLAQRPDVEAVVATSYLPLSGSISLAEVQHRGTDDSRSVTVYAPSVSLPAAMLILAGAAAVLPAARRAARTDP